MLILLTGGALGHLIGGPSVPPPRIVRPQRSGAPVALLSREGFSSGLLHAARIREHAPSLRPHLDSLQDSDLAALEALRAELEPSVAHLLHSKTAATASSSLRLGLEVAYIAHQG